MALWYGNDLELGIVTQIDEDDGTIDVNVKNREYDYAGITLTDMRGLSVGDSVLVGFYNRDRNLPFIFARSSSRAAGAGKIPTSSRNWHSWHNALYRGNWNNTNILPDLSKSETTLYEYPNAVPAPPAIGATKIHNGYVYGTEYYGNNDHRLIRISLADGAKTYATWTGASMHWLPADLLITEDSGTLYAYIIYTWGYDFYLAKYNLDTMARAYLKSEMLFNVSRYFWKRIFEDSGYIYVFFYEGSFAKYQYIRKYEKSTGNCVYYRGIDWPSFDYQNDNGYLCYGSEIRSSIECKSGSGVAFPTLANQGSSAIIYEVPAFDLSSCALEWRYAPESIEITKQYQAYLMYWYCEYIGFYGKTFNQTYSDTNLFYYFPDMNTGDKQIRSTLIACNNSVAVILSEETSITNNRDLDEPWYGYDDWQQTVWAAVDYNNYGQCIRRYVEDGQGAPLSSHPDLTAYRDTYMAPFASLAFDETPLNFSWVSKKEVNLVILDITTGEVLRTITGESYCADSATSEDSFVVPKDNLIEDVRTASHIIEVSRTKDTMYPYTGPGVDEFMGVGANEEIRNMTVMAQIDFWVPEFDPEKPYSYYWFGAYFFTMNVEGYIKYDPIAVEFDGKGLSLQDQYYWHSIPDMAGRWEYQCVIVTHPAEDVEFPMEKYIPTQYEWSQTLITDTYLFVAPAADETGRMGCFKIVDPVTHKWDLDVGPGSELLYWCCNKSRIYYFRGADRTDCTLYEISITAGTIVTTKTGVSVCSNTDGYFEPMIVDKKLVLTDSKKLSYIGQ